MALLLRGLLWLSVLGGAAAGIGLPTKNAVQSILNKQEIRTNGGNTESGKNYENYGYGSNGFGDSRTKKVESGQGTQEIQTALKDVRNQWGKQNVGKGLEVGFKNGLDKKGICKNGNSSNCYVGSIEFIDNKDKSLFGRIPIKDGDKLKNIYVKGVKCTQNTNRASAVWIGRFRTQDRSSVTRSSSQERKGDGCLGVSQSSK